MSISLTGLLYSIARDYRLSQQPLPTLSVEGVAAYLEIDPDDLRAYLDAAKADQTVRLGEAFGFRIGDDDIAFLPREAPQTVSRPLGVEAPAKPASKRPRKVALDPAKPLRRSVKPLHEVYDNG